MSEIISFVQEWLKETVFFDARYPLKTCTYSLNVVTLVGFAVSSLVAVSFYIQMRYLSNMYENWKGYNRVESIRRVLGIIHGIIALLGSLFAMKRHAHLETKPVKGKSCVADFLFCISLGYVYAWQGPENEI
jgi:hypothetical protein